MKRKHNHPYLFKKDDNGLPVGWLFLASLLLLLLWKIFN